VQSAIREAREELGLDIEIEKELGIRDDPNRDPRGHNVSRAFKGKILGGTLQAGDDAKAVITVDPKDLDTINFAFPDHKEMILEALKTTS
jgi:8-oxo-dGTP diphosphatase